MKCDDPAHGGWSGTPTTAPTMVILQAKPATGTGQ